MNKENLRKMDAPVLLITFNRPENTRKVFEKIKQAKIKRLYIFNDGPRNGNMGDIKAQSQIKSLIDEIDWECDLHTNFQEKNLGCGKGCATAISWAFENEENLIILEDDCVPSLPFFKYCNYTLEKYWHDTRIWLISGRSHQQGTRFFDNQDYIFTHYGHIWGWATWKRCWNHFDIRMKDLPNFLKSGGSLNVLATPEEGRLYNKKYHKLSTDKNLSTHAWGFQFIFSILKNAGLCIVPAKNLIQNIGHIGTHSKQKSIFQDLKADENFEITKEPLFVLHNKEYEIYHFNNHIKKIIGVTTPIKYVLRKGHRIIGWKK
ncbi:MAG: hypothetical protein KJ771_04670 [Nanoarchaeota archaeon]|nr:hypothetical protein [Nanoarchaeota archaeon]